MSQETMIKQDSVPKMQCETSLAYKRSPSVFLLRRGGGALCARVLFTGRASGDFVANRSAKHGQGELAQRWIRCLGELFSQENFPLDFYLLFFLL
jgi:hypothetical protein